MAYQSYHKSDWSQQFFLSVFVFQFYMSYNLIICQIIIKFHLEENNYLNFEQNI